MSTDLQAIEATHGDEDELRDIVMMSLTNAFERLYLDWRQQGYAPQEALDRADEEMCDAVVETARFLRLRPPAKEDTP